MAGKAAASSSFFKKCGLPLAVLAMVAIFMAPTPADLTTAGHRMLGILVFAVIIWITETVTYPVSASIIATLMILCLGLSPDPQDTSKILGTSNALKTAFAGISASGTVLVGAALFLAAAMMHTGLDKRIALFVLSKVGAKTNRILAGMIFVGFVLAFFVPSTTVRVGCIVPIVLGIIAAFKMEKTSRFAALLMIATVHAASIWNIGIKTAAAQNMVALGFIDKQLRANITWSEWFIAAAPYAAIMSVILYFVCWKLLKPETMEVEGGDATVKEARKELGPMKASEKKLIHGDHPMIALSPWTVREAFDAAVMAVNYAERFRTPVILLMDEIVGHLREKVVLPEAGEIEIYPRRKPGKTRAEGYQPYTPDEDLVPNVADFGQGYHIHVTGLIHDETGFPIGSPKITAEAIDRMHQKIERVRDEITHTEEFFMEDAEYAVMS